MCLNPSIQDKLRTEVQAVQTDHPTMDDLNALPYLDAVVRETLRFYSTVGGTLRTVVGDDCIPLSEPYIDRQGVKQDHIKYVPCRGGCSWDTD